MLPALILALAALGIAVLRLLSYRAQMLEMARILEETPAESNLCLTVRMPGAVPGGCVRRSTSGWRKGGSFAWKPRKGSGS